MYTTRACWVLWALPALLHWQPLIFLSWVLKVERSDQGAVTHAGIPTEGMAHAGTGGDVPVCSCLQTMTGLGRGGPQATSGGQQVDAPASPRQRPQASQG